LGSLIRGLEADEGKGLLVVLSREEFKALNITELGEKSHEISFSGGDGESLHVEVATLLGVLVLEGLVHKLTLTLTLLEPRADVESDSFEFLIVKGLNSSGGTTRAVLAISNIGGFVADEGVGSIFMGSEVDGGDAAKFSEDSAHILFVPASGQVFDVNIVVCLAEFLLVTGSELDTDGIISIGGLSESLVGGLRITEADKTISAGRVVVVKRDLARDNFTELGKFLLKGLTDDVLGDLADEDIVAGKAGYVRSEEFVGEGEGTAVLIVDLEVTEGIAHFLEFGVVSDLDDSGVEGLVEVATNLRHALDLVAGEILNDLGQLDTGVLLLGEVVDVEEVFVLLRAELAHLFLFVCWEKECFFCFCFLGVSRKNDNNNY